MLIPYAIFMYNLQSQMCKSHQFIFYIFMFYLIKNSNLQRKQKLNLDYKIRYQLGTGSKVKNRIKTISEFHLFRNTGYWTR